MQGQTKQLLDGPLKHIRAAALAAALVPLASVFAAPASAQDCSSGGCQSCRHCVHRHEPERVPGSGEPGIEGVESLRSACCATARIPSPQKPVRTGSIPSTSTLTGTYTVGVLIPTGLQVSPPSSAAAPAFPTATASASRRDVHVNTPTSFGFFTSSASNPGTGTPGYWKNHPEAWPVPTITVGIVNGVGGVTYTKAQAIAWLGKVGKDKTTTMFSSLVPAILNGLIGNDTSCVSAGHHRRPCLDGHLRTGGQRRRPASKLRVVGGRTHPPDARRLQQRAALRSASQLAPSMPDGPFSKGHRALFPRVACLHDPELDAPECPIRTGPKTGSFLSATPNM